MRKFQKSKRVLAAVVAAGLLVASLPAAAGASAAGTTAAGTTAAGTTAAGTTAAGTTAAGTAVTGTAGFGGGHEDSVVRTDKGPIRGTVTETYRVFQGIPYAAPPEGALRWRSPMAARPWTTTRDATKPGNRCPQAGDFIGDDPSITEDCLYLNVTTPKGAGKKDLPVVFWIHGGGFFSGSGDIYGAERLATKGDVVVVTTNYRLGVLGFLSHPALENGGQKSGNFGLEDQQAALNWVRKNIRAFGGNPRNVTIAGESAGGVSVCDHLAAPSSKGLFHKAIVQSGPCHLTTQWPYEGTWVTRPRADSLQQGKELATKLECTDAACLRRQSVETLLEKSDGGQTYGPSFGRGTMLPISPAEAIDRGTFNRVPVIQGTTHDEHQTFTALLALYMKHELTAEEYVPMLEETYGKPLAAEIARRYPLAGFDSPSEALSSVFTDAAWSCPALSTDRKLSRYVPTYAFEFDDVNTPWFAKAPKPSWDTDAFHAGELRYLFSGAYGSSLSPAQQVLSDTMVRNWTRFAHLGTPSWPSFDTRTEHTQRLAPEPGSDRSVDLEREHRCGFWQR